VSRNSAKDFSNQKSNNGDDSQLLPYGNTTYKMGLNFKEYSEIASLDRACDQDKSIQECRDE
jgi:hypothetical protein